MYPFKNQNLNKTILSIYHNADYLLNCVFVLLWQIVAKIQLK